MLIATSAAPDPNDRPTRMTPRQRRHIYRMIDDRPALYRKLKSDPRSNLLVTDLMNRYRAELLLMLQEMLEASLEPKRNHEPIDPRVDPNGPTVADPRGVTHLSPLSVAGVGSPGPPPGSTTPRRTPTPHCQR